MKITRRKKDEWVIDFTLNKKRIRRIIEGTRRMAEQAATLEKERIYRMKCGIPEHKKKIAFEDFVKIYIERHSKNRRSHANNRFHIKELESFFKGKYLNNITPGEIESYKLKRIKEVSGSTVNRELTILKTMYNKAIDWEEWGIERNPVNKVDFYQEKNFDVKILSKDEIKRLLEAAERSKNPDFKNFLTISLNTGMRKMEVLKLKWANIDFKTRLITVPAEISKSKKPRKIPTNDSVIRALDSMKKVGEFIFHNPKTGTHVTNIRGAFQTARSRAGLPKLRIHDLRHTAASLMVNSGVDVVSASKILGHSRIEMTMRYCHSIEDSLRGAVEILGKIFERSRKKVDKMQDSTKIDMPVTRFVS